MFSRGESKSKDTTSEDVPNLLDMVEPEPGFFIPKALANHWADIKKTARETVRIEATPSSNLTLRQSKFGHFPCIPKNFNYPLDRDGNYMFPLAQINFSEVPKLKGFPESGYLQFYIQAGECYGLSFDDHIPSDFKVLFFEESDVAEHEEDFSFLEEVLKNEYVPVFCPHSLVFEHKLEYIGLGDINAELNPYFNLDNVLKQYEAIADELEDAIYDIFHFSGHKIGGYAYFAQADPRTDGSYLQHYQLLFQIDSGDEICWGDAGVANFFIHPDKLAKKDFTDVYYNWDCF